MSHPQKIGGRPALYPLATILRAKAMFLDGSSYAVIAATCGVRKEWIQRHAHHKQWARLRQSPEHRAQALASLNEELAQFKQTVAVEAQSLTLSAMPLVRSAIDRDSPRDFKDAAQGVKTMLEVATIATASESAGAVGALGSGVNLFFFSGVAKRVEKDVTPVSDAMIQQRVVSDPEF